MAWFARGYSWLSGAERARGLEVLSSGGVWGYKENLNRSFHTARGCQVQKKVGARIRALLIKADNGDMSAANEIGWRYDYGIKVRENPKLAAKWYKIAAEKDLRIAQYNLAKLYEMGRGVGKNNRKMIYWLKKSAEQNYGEALSDLGWCYFQGVGVTRNINKAIFYYRKGVVKGIDRLLFNLGLCYLDGSGVRRSVKISERYFKKSMALGHVASCYWLARIYFGLEDQRRPEKARAMRLMRKAAGLGDKDAISFLKM